MRTLTSRLRPALLALSLSCICSSGCAALLDGAVREMHDHGDQARYPHQGYWAHVIDAASEPDPAPPCHPDVVVIHHH